MSTPMMGSGVKPNHLNEAKSYLDKEENLLAIFRYGESMRASYLLITDKRMIKWDRSITNSGMDSITYGRMTTVFTKKSILGTGLVVTVDGSDTAFPKMKRHEVDAVQKLLREQIEKNQRPGYQPIQIQEDPMKLLELRYVRGEITEQQFTAMKATLMGQESPKQKLGQLCPSCGIEIKPGAKFCISCGSAL